MNSVILIGRLSTDVVLNKANFSDVNYARFCIAIDRGMTKEKREEAESMGRQTADFVNICVFGKQAENCKKFLEKGRNVAIQGRIQTGTYLDKFGEKKYTFEVLADRVQFIDYGDKKEDIKPFGEFDTANMPFQEVEDEEIPF